MDAVAGLLRLRAYAVIECDFYPVHRRPDTSTYCRPCYSVLLSAI